MAREKRRYVSKFNYHRKGTAFAKFIIIFVFFVCAFSMVSLSAYQISIKHYIPPLDNSVIYYDLNINNATIELSSNDDITVYDDSNSITQCVYTYDWFNKINQLGGLESVFTYESLPKDFFINSFNKPTYSDLAKIIDFDLLGISEMLVIDDYKKGRNVDMSFNNSLGCWQLYATNDDLKKGYINAINRVNDEIVDNDYSLNTILKIINYPVKVVSALFYNLVVIMKFIFIW